MFPVAHPESGRGLVPQPPTIRLFADKGIFLPCPYGSPIPHPDYRWWGKFPPRLLLKTFLESQI